MNQLILLLVGVFVTIIGALPFGLVNLSVVDVTLKQGRKPAMQVAYGAAWVEVFLEKQGWIRVDPTAIVAPERVTLGLADSLLSENLPDFLVQTGIGRMRTFFRRTAYISDAINLKWDTWFMGYSRLEQVHFVAGAFSRVAWRRVLWMAGLGGVLAVLAVMGWIRFKNAKKAGYKDPVKEAYDLFCAKLEGVGIGSLFNAQGNIGAQLLEETVSQVSRSDVLAFAPRKR